MQRIRIKAIPLSGTINSGITGNSHPIGNGKLRPIRQIKGANFHLVFSSTPKYSTQ